MMNVLFDKRIRRVETDSELHEFAAGFATVIQQKTRGVLRGEIPIEYLRASQVTAVFDGDERMLAGYVIGKSPPFRLLEFVPEDARRQLQPPAGASWDDCCEATCFWRTAEVTPLFMSARVWPRILADAMRSKKRYLLGHNQSARLDELYSRGNMGVTLYSGPSVHGLPSRLSAFETEGILLRASHLIVTEVFRRFAKRFRPRRAAPSAR
jgi:hypothetical protein